MRRFSTEYPRRSHGGVESRLRGTPTSTFSQVRHDAPVVARGPDSKFAKNFAEMFVSAPAPRCAPLEGTVPFGYRPGARDGHFARADAYEHVRRRHRSDGETCARAIYAPRQVAARSPPTLRRGGLVLNVSFEGWRPWESTETHFFSALGVAAAAARDLNFDSGVLSAHAPPSSWLASLSRKSPPRVVLFCQRALPHTTVKRL